MMPNSTALVTRFLQSDAATEPLIDVRAYSKLPKTKTYPLVRVTRIGGSTVTDPYWIDQPLFQIDCWATTATLAWQVGETCRSALAQRFNGALSFLSGALTGVVSGATVGGLTETDDDSATPPLALARFDLTFTVHP